MDPRDEDGHIIYDRGVNLLETWRAMESLADQGKCRAIGLSDVVLENLAPLYEAARIKPAVVQVESHPYLPQTELLEFCKQKGIVFMAFAPLGHGIRPGPLEDQAVLAIARQTSLTQPRSCSPGEFNVERPSLRPRKLWIERARTTTSPRFQKLPLRRSTAFNREAG